MADGSGSPRTLEGFPASRVRGVPGDASYDEERSDSQAGCRHRPDAIVCAAGAEDVTVAVDHASAHGPYSRRRRAGRKALVDPGNLFRFHQSAP